MPVSQAVLITGCSSGIGKATALRLHRAGYPVYATARKVESLQDLADAGITTLALDVSDETSMHEAVDRVVADHGAVGVLINNAGYGLSGPIEEVSIDAVRDQFETNVFGAARLTQLVLPRMRSQHHGTIVNVSSLYGRFVSPGGGYYHASKHALEAMSEALRYEVKKFGIKVAIVEPGPVRTPFGATAVDSMAELSTQGPYAKFNADSINWFKATYIGPKRNLPGRMSVSAEQVAGVIEKAMTSSSSRARYPVGFLVRMLFTVRRFAPPPVLDAFIRLQFPKP